MNSFLNESEAADLAKILYNTGILKILIIVAFGHTGIYLFTEYFKNLAFKKRRREDHKAVQESICLFSTERNSDVREIRDAILEMVNIMRRNGVHHPKPKGQKN